MDFYNATTDSPTIENTLNQLLSDDETIGCLVACNDAGVPIGFLTYIAHFSTWKSSPICYLQDLYVEEEHRQHGIANQLLEQLKNIANKRDWSRIYWLTKPDNVVARKFYDKVAKDENWVRYIIDIL